MGRWFEKLFRQAGISTILTDLCQAPPCQELVASCDVVMLAVPAPAVEEVMKAIGAFIRPDALVMDISSVKKRPIDFMLKYSQSEVIGAHPLFGPTANSLAGQLFFLCPARTEKWVYALKKFLEGYGSEVVEIDPDQHNRLMACFQTLRHIMLAALGRTVVRMGYHSGSQTSLAGVWFNQLLAILHTQSQQPGDLYADIAIENPHSCETLKVFQESLRSLVDSIANRDRDSLIEAMEEANNCFLPN